MHPRSVDAQCRHAVLSVHRSWVVAGLLVLVASCGGGSGEGADPERFCRLLDRLATNDPFLAFGDTATPDEIGIAFTALRDRAAELVDAAPDDVRPAARRYSEAVAALDDLLAEVDYRTDVDARAYTAAQLDYVEAAERLERHLDDSC